MAIPGVEEVNGKLIATARNIEPPSGWTNDFEALGGEAQWKVDGNMHSLLESVDIDTTNLKPLFATLPENGDATTLFETGTPTAFYLFDDYNYAVYRITAVDDLATLVESIGDKNRGVNSLQLEKIL